MSDHLVLNFISQKVFFTQVKHVKGSFHPKPWANVSTAPKSRANISDAKITFSSR